MLQYTLLTAERKIRCLRCTARSSKTGLQCGRPALKASKTQKCQFHGGRSTGPTTPEGKARLAALHTVHGRETKAARAEFSAASARINQLEDAAYLLGMMTGPRTRGRKPRGYVPVRTLDDIKQMMFDELLNLDRASVEEVKNIARKTLVRG